MNTEDSGMACVIRLEGDLDVSGSAELKHTLLQAISNNSQSQIDLSHITELDVTALQLLWAAARQAERLGVSLEFAGASPSLVESLHDAGFNDFPRASFPRTGETTAASAESSDDR